ncbi:nitroreductase family protein [Ferrimonas aestuarii]|uniref:SagB/ThcOx family dehydrogenase n=1 Tax=Ferrimonas aestuarii TaxID=2569539 RepID=A0A4U1BKM0_9GAMM|nr:nitroreductase family protein [Ferrimonas aestuarii]TKB52023.1 SagB/ThcOx family dehydrogenase [Ferrimonas aestuarii]
MKRTLAAFLALGLIATTANLAQAHELDHSDNDSTIKLVEPQIDESATLRQALQNRKSVRKFANRPIEAQDLSNLLWAAAGINRDNGGRTVPLLGDIAIYVAMEQGTYHYQAEEHQLQQVLSEDIRGRLSAQKVVGTAPVVFIMTIDDASFSDGMKRAMEKAHGMDFYYGNQVAFSTQNIYLYAGTNDMNAVVIGGVHRDKIDQMLKLKDGHHAYLVQLVGYKK